MHDIYNQFTSNMFGKGTDCKSAPAGEDRDLLKDPAMLKRLNEIEKMDKDDKTHILHVLDGFIKSVKLKNIAAM
jgi:hypothetical protein